MAPRGTNSSKTEHVMNLLRKSGSAETPHQAVAEENASAAASASAAAPRKLPILTALNADVAVSSKIKDALESALLIEEATPTPVATLDMYADTDEPQIPAPAPKPAPVETAPAPAVSPAPVEPTPVIPAPALTPETAASSPVIPAPVVAPTPVTAVPEPAPVAPPAPAFSVPVAAPPAETAPTSGGKLSQAEIEQMLNAMVAEEEAKYSPPVETTSAPVQAVPAPTEEAPTPVELPELIPEPIDNAELFNIMQLLAEEKADKYIKMFGLCDCKRCRQDVLALTLNEISTKYVVMPRAELTIRNDMYRSHYDGEITVQILRACQKVMENPRHKK